MRYAAEQAGIGGGGRDGSASEDASPSRLVLALEPEAAAIAAVPGVRKAREGYSFVAHSLGCCVWRGADPEAWAHHCKRRPRHDRRRGVSMGVGGRFAASEHTAVLA